MGKVVIWQCRDQYEEAEKIATECKKLIGAGTKPEEIAVLLRSDHNGQLSKPIVEKLRADGLPVANTASALPEIKDGIEQVLALLRLSVNEDDSLAMRDMLSLEACGIGKNGLAILYENTRQQHGKFAQIVRTIAREPDSLPRYGGPISCFVDSLDQRTDAVRSAGTLMEQTSQAISLCEFSPDTKKPIEQHFDQLCLMLDSTATIDDLLRLESTVDDVMEQDDTSRGIRILSMHQAKGLSFDVCFVAAAEDEFIPGKSVGTESEDDERRLLYVSMSRARHELVISYCNRRIGSQERLGAQTGRTVHELSRFLRDLNLPIA